MLRLSDPDPIRALLRVDRVPRARWIHIEVLTIDVDVMLLNDAEDRLLNIVEGARIAVITKSVMLSERIDLRDRRILVNAFRLEPQ